MFDDLKYPQLKKACKERGLPVSGKKAELVERLNEFEASKPPTDDDKPAPAAEPATPAKKPKQETASANEPDPDNPNWTRSGHWVRRRKGYKSPEEKAAEKAKAEG